ncbi:hypothetical protein CAOG_04207 [Capsaspora owczarzaki ATCC 30864]|uniref:VPS9 domain-containing protein n=1 Tax=Capsaspora owczarzaki (strain ATCC 30864) TaxID=595528 RepID=A0A0D2WQT1_CAPO3|nr:hypothetical protein CAOG_04207 [Capsaspora owczarzaki ATCC 30864]KJE93413.1 hypothetical protein CAOG_004207 [Capsaspora owczarzaki ATCC 30864]|eukprot:XP_004348032.2 hypothetical protein CAOG_04207 [Capsaspora owczarzaki ATCC 30864]
MASAASFAELSRRVVAALSLDEETNDRQAAFTAYLQCVAGIAQHLLQFDTPSSSAPPPAATGDEERCVELNPPTASSSSGSADDQDSPSPAPSTALRQDKSRTKLFLLARLCIDRAEAISTVTSTNQSEQPNLSSQAPPRLPTPIQVQSQSQAPSQAPSQALSQSQTQSPSQAPSQAPPPHAQSPSQTQSQTLTNSHTAAPSHQMHVVLQPMERAQTANRILHQTFQLQIASVQDEAKRSAMYLSMMRKCYENLSTARRQQAELAAKIKERNDRIRLDTQRQAIEREHQLDQQNQQRTAKPAQLTLQQVQKALSDGGASAVINLLASMSSGATPAVIANTAANNGVITRGEATMIANVAVFDASQKRAKESLQMLQEIASHPEEARRVEQFVLFVFDQHEHPLSRWLAESLYTVITAFSKPIQEADAESYLEAFVQQVHTILQRLTELLPFAYLQLNSETARDQLSLTIESLVFPPSMPILLRLHSLSSQVALCEYRLGLDKLENSSLQSLGIDSKFWLGASGSESMSSKTSPYASVISLLQSLPQVSTPSAKLDILVQSIQGIVQQVEIYCRANSLSVSAHAVGGDELMPLLTHVVVHANIRTLPTDCWMMGEFMDDSAMMGQEGFCLSNLQVVVDHIRSLGETPEVAAPSCASSDPLASTPSSTAGIVPPASPARLPVSSVGEMFDDLSDDEGLPKV